MKAFFALFFEILTFSSILSASVAEQQWEWSGDDKNENAHVWSVKDGETTEYGSSWNWEEEGKSVDSRSVAWDGPDGHLSISDTNWTTTEGEIGETKERRWTKNGESGMGVTCSITSSLGNTMSWNWTKAHHNMGQSAGGGIENKMQNGTEFYMSWSYGHSINVGKSVQDEVRYVGTEKAVENYYKKVLSATEEKERALKKKIVMAAATQEPNSWTWTDPHSVGNVWSSLEKNSLWTYVRRLSATGITTTWNWNNPEGYGTMEEVNWREAGGRNVYSKVWNWKDASGHGSMFIMKKEAAAGESEGGRNSFLGIRRTKRQEENNQEGGNPFGGWWKVVANTAEKIFKSFFSVPQGQGKHISVQSWDWNAFGAKGTSWSWVGEWGNWTTWIWHMINDTETSGGGALFIAKNGSSSATSWRKLNGEYDWTINKDGGMNYVWGPSFQVRTEGSSWGFNTRENGEWFFTIDDYNFGQKMFEKDAKSGNTNYRRSRDSLDIRVRGVMVGSDGKRSWTILVGNTKHVYAGNLRSVCRTSSIKRIFVAEGKDKDGDSNLNRIGYASTKIIVGKKNDISAVKKQPLSFVEDNTIRD